MSEEISSKLLRLKPEDMIVMPAGTGATIKEDENGKYITDFTMIKVCDPQYLDLVMSIGE